MAQTSPVQPGRREFCASPRGVVDEALVEGDWRPGTPARMLKSVQEAAVKLYSYVVEHDAGYAPNPYFGFCTLCRCKFQKPGVGRKNIVELAEEGDWVIGTGGASKRSAGHGKLVYAMLVTEKLTREEYFSDSRFLQQKPMKTNTSTYEQKRGDNVRPRRVFEKREQFVLVSRHFFYFGNNAIDIPAEFRRRGFEKKGPGFRCPSDSADVCRFVDWLEKERKPGEPCQRLVDKTKGDKECKSSC